MLKIYKIHNYVSVDGSPWRRVIRGWLADTPCIAAEDHSPDHPLCELTFEDAHEYLSNNELDGIWADKTFFRKKPIICARYADAFDDVTYKHFQFVSYKTEYVEWVGVPLDWIINNLPADQAIQYLKERGITACPMNF